MKKNYKKYAFILAGILILIVVLFLIGKKIINGNGTSSVIAEKDLGIGNTGGNLSNGCIVANSDDWIYFNNPNSQNMLYKMKSDGTNSVLVKEDKGKFLNIVGDYIYYINEYDRDALYKTKLDGSERIKLTEFPVIRVFVSDGWIYYTKGQENNLCRMTINGEKKEALSFYGWGDLNIIKDIAYYTSLNDFNIYKTTIGSKKQMKICNDMSACMIVVDDWIYYVNFVNNDDYKIFKIKIDGTGRQKVSDDNAVCINVYKGNIYYSNVSDGYKIYKIDTNGNNKAKVNNDKSARINIFNDWIYYNNEDDPDNYEAPYRIKIDGTGREALK